LEAEIRNMPIDASWSTYADVVEEREWNARHEAKEHELGPNVPADGKDLQGNELAWEQIIA
jgi:hypothetical protein